MIVYLNNILIYTKDASHTHVDAIWWILKKLKKYGFFANLKKCHFHKDEFRFLEYIMSAQRVQIEEENIEAVKN